MFSMSFFLSEEQKWLCLFNSSSVKLAAIVPRPPGKARQPAVVPAGKRVKIKVIVILQSNCAGS